MAKAIYLTESDAEILREIVQDYRTRPRNSRSRGEQFTVSGSPEVYTAKLPTAGIPARVGTIPGQATCDIYYTDVTTPNTPTLTVATSVTRLVFNIYPVAVYGTGTIYTRIQRDKFGRWLVEKPPYALKCTLATTCSLNSTCTVNVYLNGASTSNTLTAWLNWMANTLVASGKEAVVQYFEDEAKWVFTNVKC